MDVVDLLKLTRTQNQFIKSKWQETDRKRQTNGQTCSKGEVKRQNNNNNVYIYIIYNYI